MGKNKENILFADLVARIPYNVKVEVEIWDNESESSKMTALPIYSINSDKYFYVCTDEDELQIHIDEIRPYLRKMSSMTEKEFYELCELGVSLPPFKDYYGQMQYYGSGGEWSIVDVKIEDIIKYVNYLNAHHFDFRGLIPMGLALEAPEGMYDIKND